MVFCATIHDVAQVFGVGYSLDETTGDMATIVKLLHVAMLAPVVVLRLTIRYLSANEGNSYGLPALPIFVFGFITIVIANSFCMLPQIL